MNPIAPRIFIPSINHAPAVPVKVGRRGNMDSSLDENRARVKRALAGNIPLIEE